jgi:hypothetical protein
MGRIGKPEFALALERAVQEDEYPGVPRAILRPPP